MEQDKSNPQEEIKNCGRRSRKDEEGRDYVCGCGKSYLSYPALYTHIKTKHDGQRPQGTFKVGVVAGTRRTNSNTSINANPGTSISIAAPNSAQKVSNNNGGGSAGKIANSPNKGKSNIQRPNVPLAPSSKVDLHILREIQELTKFEDFKLISELDLEKTGSNYTLPDNRVKKQQIGQQIFQNYNQLIRQSETYKKSNRMRNGEVSGTERRSSKDNEQQYEKSENDINGNEQGVGKWTKLTNKSSPETVLLVYLLGAGRFTNQIVLQIYSKFAKFFLECFQDHIQQVYQVCFKNNEYYESKERDKEKQRERERQRDNPYICYQYSYPPSSSKSKTYNNYNNFHSNSKQTMNNHSLISNLAISKKQCKYFPLVCQFFVRIYLPYVYQHSPKQDQYQKELIELICHDFCTWMYRNKITVVQVGFNKKYQINKKQAIKSKIQQKIINMNEVQQKNKAIENDKQQENDEFIVRNLGKSISPNKAGKGAKPSEGSRSKTKRRQRRMREQRQLKARRHQRQQKSSQYLQDQKERIKQINESQQDENEMQMANRNLNDLDSDGHPNDDQQSSYKIGHEIVQQIQGRDRSGSIQHYINGHPDHEHDEPHQENFNENGNEAHQGHEVHHASGDRNRRGRGDNYHSANSERNIAEEEIQIQKYINT